MRSRPLLCFCVGAGLFLHGVALFALGKKSFAPSELTLKTSPFLNTLATNPLHKQKNRHLSEVFQHAHEAKSPTSQPTLTPVAEFAPPLPLTLFAFEDEFTEGLSTDISPPSTDNPMSELPEKPSPMIFYPPQEESTSKAPRFLKALFNEGAVTSGHEANKLDKHRLMIGGFPDLPFTPHNFSDNSDNEKTLTFKNRQEPTAHSEPFDLKVECAPKRTRPGYVFKITLTPKKESQFKRIAHHYTFLLDRSNSISRKRYNYGRKAVFEALAYLKPRDTFNILLFDDRISRLSNKPLTYSPESIAKAKQFLERHPHGGLFASSDIYSSLHKIIPKASSPDEVYTTILLSDGDTYLNTEQQRQTIGQWICENGGKVSVFTAASGSGNNLLLLETMAHFNQGKLIYSKEHTSLPAKLCKLMRAIQNPIGKSLTTKAITADKKHNVLLEPKNSRLPLLYEGQPLILYGSTNRLSPFTLFIQGKDSQHSFDIVKKIDLSQASTGTLNIETIWTSLLAEECIEKYFEEGKRSYIKQAKELLAPLNLPVPFDS